MGKKPPCAPVPSDSIAGPPVLIKKKKRKNEEIYLADGLLSGILSTKRQRR